MQGQEDGETRSEATTVIDLTKTSKTIDMIYTKDGRKGKVVWSIYEIVGYTLRICLPTAAKDTALWLVELHSSCWEFLPRQR